jgi:exopolyphosphatase/pppGpp-phosphohydrolase
MITFRPKPTATIELSSTSVKLIQGGKFYKTVTNTASYLKNNILDPELYKENVLPAIKEYVKMSGVSPDRINCIGTAVYRNSRNIDEIKAIIRKETGLRLRVLSGKEEAMLPLQKYMGYTKKYDYVLTIDAGGLSTDIACSSDDWISLNVGSRDSSKLTKELQRLEKAFGWLRNEDSVIMIGLGKLHSSPRPKYLVEILEVLGNHKLILER